jgi:hypothetical protein
LKRGQRVIQEQSNRSLAPAAAENGAEKTRVGAAKEAAKNGSREFV